MEVLFFDNGFFFVIAVFLMGLDEVLLDGICVGVVIVFLIGALGLGLQST